jgi:hypothetical protein
MARRFSGAGTSRTFRDVRLESANRPKTDISEPLLAPGALTSRGCYRVRIKRPTENPDMRTWRASLIRRRTEFLGHVEEPDREAAEVAGDLTQLTA